ncbi:SusD/RagB family nutrient-binding outer membrane lipoprotein [Sphingobacterium daejeonense]|uniref:SusD/RagB family nutrient-binding outer membrane lipoprotein n=1 Tax=Sphingobacterium daejeonense TaxID=371142 RepID=A0ABW3RJU4_9SPHI
MMKILNKSIIKISIFVVALTFTACSKFLDVNDTPNNPLKVPPSSLLPNGLSGTAFANSNELNRFASTIMSVTAGASGSPSAYDRYIVTGDDFGNQWRFELYGGALINYKKMLEAAELANGPAYSGVGKIMMAYTFAMTTMYGEISHIRKRS